MFWLISWCPPSVEPAPASSLLRTNTMALPVLPARGYSRPTHHGTDTQLSTNPARVSARGIPFVRLVSVSLALASVSLGGRIEGADIPHAVRPCRVAASSHSRNVICNEIPAKIHINQRLHQ